MSSKAPSLSQKVANIQYMPVLITATAASKEPADGFIVKDIVKMTFESTPTRVFLQQYLVNQLCGTNNVYVKIKVLRLFLVLLEEGHIEFKQNLRKQSEAFTDAAKLRPHQPKNGHLVSECGRIRDMASKILDMLFEDTPELRRKPIQSSYTSQQGNGQGQSSESGSRIMGFGNGSYQAPSNQETTTSKIKKFLGVQPAPKTVVYDPSYVTLDPVPHNQTSSSPFTPQIGNTSESRYLEGDLPSGRDHVTGRAGGGWDVPSEPNNTPAPQQDHTPPSFDEPQNDGQDFEATTEQERRLVDEITAPGGIKAAPPREMLNSFVSRCRCLDSQAVVEFLRLKLQSEENQVILRALFVVETLSRSDLPDILSHLDLVLEQLSTLSQSSHTTIKTKANKILMQLTVQNAQMSQRAAVSKTVSSNQVESSDILNIGGVSTGAGPTAEEEPVMTQEQAKLAAGLFGGLTVSGEKVARPKPVKQVRKPVKKEPQVVPQTSSAYEDLLGLNDTYQDSIPQQPAPSQPSLTEDVAPPEDDSLLTFGSDDEEFDPLNRSDSINRSNSLSKKSSFTTGQMSLVSMPTTGQTGLVSMPTTGQTGLVSMPTTGQTGLVPSPVINSRNDLPGTITTTQPSATTDSNLLGDLSGLDLSKTSPMATPPLLHREQPQYAALQSLQQPSMAGPSNSSLATPVNVGVYPSSQGPMMTQGGVLYAPVGQPYGGGVAQGGGVQQVPMMYMPMAGQGRQYGGQPGLNLMMGGEARPVQRATPTTNADTPTSDSGFSFLGKSNKGSAFDFVQDEMRASKK